jgi:5'-nucleotidase
MKVDPASGAVANIDVRNVVMTPGEYPADPKVSAYLAMVKERGAAVLARPVARLGATVIPRRESEAGESPLGDVITDAVVAATRDKGVQIGFMNMGGVRRDLEAGADLTASFGQAQAVLPFGNTLVVMDLTGAQLRNLLEQQWARSGGGYMLQVSSGLSYQWDSTRPVGSRVVPGSLKVSGAAVEDGKTYRVAANNFLAEGGDNFPEFAKGANKVDTQIRDLDALIDYLGKHEGTGGQSASFAAPAARIHKVR